MVHKSAGHSKTANQIRFHVYVLIFFNVGICCWLHKIEPSILECSSFRRTVDDVYGVLENMPYRILFFCPPVFLAPDHPAQCRGGPPLVCIYELPCLRIQVGATKERHQQEIWGRGKSRLRISFPGFATLLPAAPFYLRHCSWLPLCPRLFSLDSRNSLYLALQN